jgi:hypothetical protein
MEKDIINLSTNIAWIKIRLYEGKRDVTFINDYIFIERCERGSDGDWTYISYYQNKTETNFEVRDILIIRGHHYFTEDEVKAYLTFT